MEFCHGDCHHVGLGLYGDAKTRRQGQAVILLVIYIVAMLMISETGLAIMDARLDRRLINRWTDFKRVFHVQNRLAFKAGRGVSGWFWAPAVWLK